MTKVNECVSCAYAYPNSDTGFTECHRFPPQVTLDNDDQENPVRSFWPEIAQDDWCGEFKGCENPLSREDTEG